MLLPRLKLALIFDRAFHAMADMHWRMLGGLILFHALSSWLLLAIAGEKGLHAFASFFYWYATTAYTVGYGDLSPQSAAGRLVTAVWIFPGAIAAFTTVVAKVLAAIGDVWRTRRSGKGDYSRMSDAILLIGYHPARTPKMIDELCAELSKMQTLVLLTRQTVTDPDPRIRYVQSESLTSPAALARAGAARASRVLVYASSDADTLAATLAVAAAVPETAHVVCFFEDADSARLTAQHCPKVEVVLASAPEMLARAARDPGSSQVITALTSHLDDGATLFSLTWEGEDRPMGDLTQGLWKQRATLLAHQPAGAKSPRFNPPGEADVKTGDRIFYVSHVRLDQPSLAGS
ncbi:potassium channel family protein [Brevundimonas faecalis]|uniref:Voltage-gated potassium channel n=1 Tax=Brevundimonas faecalis TaxID=947378 RepID=A0ABV2RD40_9CAUL